MIDPHLRYRRHVEAPITSAGATSPILILVSGRDTAVVPGTGVRFPSFPVAPGSMVTRALEHNGLVHEIATWRGHPVYALGVQTDELDEICEGDGLQREDFRSLYLAISDVEQGLFARAIQIVEWDETSRFCGSCGSPTTVADSESVARCPACGKDQYPRIAPAMIVAVVRDGKVLLARAPRFKGAFHSLLAGYVEPGESVEECVHREVYEEAGVRVKNIRYSGSQSWPFPHSLMLGYTAEWASGELRIDEEEIEHADWYGPDELPTVPSELSIAGRMIARWREAAGGSGN